MDIPVYTDIIFEGSNEEPLELDFGTEFVPRIVIIKGEGGNRELCVRFRDGSVDLHVDLHVYDGKHYAYIAPSEISAYASDRYAQKTLVYIINALGIYGTWDRTWWIYTKEQLNELFKYLVTVH